MTACIESFFRDIQVPGFVVHAVEVAVFEEAVITAAGSFPGCIMFEDDVLWDRLVKALFGFSGQLVDQEIIGEEFALVADVHVGGFCGGGRSGCGGAAEEKRQTNQSQIAHGTNSRRVARAGMFQNGVLFSRSGGMGELKGERKSGRKKRG